MASSNTAVTATVSPSTDIALAGRIAAALTDPRRNSVAPAVREKLKLCLLDFFACAFEAHSLPWARQAAALATAGAGPCTIIGTDLNVPAGDATFANSVSGHGLVREDMHTGSVSHLGIVVLPALLATSQLRKVDGKSFMAAAVVGYEVGGRIGRALITPEFARTFRPTGFVGPLAAAAACSHVQGQKTAVAASALSLAANMAGGQNQWPHTGADEMFFEAGLASRSGLMASQLAGLGAHGSEKALDGEAGLLTAYRPDHMAPDVRLFEGEPEIMSVFFKPVPVCNFAQTPCLAAIALAKDEKIYADDIVSINVKATRAAKAYPGCDYEGPFARVLQAKMSIHFAVASAFLRGMVDESSYIDLNNPKLLALAHKVSVEVDAGLTNAFPAKQGAEVIVKLKDGRTLSRALPDVVPANTALVRSRFRDAATKVIGADRAAKLESGIDDLENCADVGSLMGLSAPQRRNA